MRYVALLRGVNVGPHRQIGMADLRQVLTEAGVRDVATHLRSGNVLLTSDQRPDRLPAALEKVIGEEFGTTVRVVVRDATQMAGIVARCPYATAAAEDPTKVHVTFLEPMPPPAVWDAIDADAFLPDEFTTGDGLVYLHLPNGMARTKLPARVEEAATGSVATTRNWRTVTALADLIAPC